MGEKQFKRPVKDGGTCLLSHRLKLTVMIPIIVSKRKILTWVSIESDRPQKRAFGFNTSLHSQLSWRSRRTCNPFRLTSIGFAFWVMALLEFFQKRRKKKEKKKLCLLLELGSVQGCFWGSNCSGSVGLF
ncbi:hypothetical protein VNO77_43511 [Canavalia gladiata]|uniref:Uncharacterized protein n=1 Tax=Canavalia gladiata TaxID=3824 RepID=A0AAN9JUC4_CANGL